MPRSAALLACLSALAFATAAAAQQAPEPADTTDPAEPIAFEADELVYDETIDRITASGNVLVRRDGQQLTADTVTYDRTSGVVAASGNVLVVSKDGTRAVADRFELTESLRDGAVENILLVLADGARLAARSGVREDGRSTLDRAVYSPCLVVDSEGCPQEPVWSIKAARVVHDPVKGRVRYRQARLEMFGVPVLALPSLSHPDSFDRNQSGILSPDIRYSRELGGELALPYFWSLAPNQDLTATAHVYTSVNPVLGLEYRHLFEQGPIRLAGRITYAGGQRIDDTGAIVATPSAVRGYFEGNGRLEHGNGWRSTFSSRLTTDDNFPGRYQISLDTRLRSTYALERFETDRYFSVRGWVFQGLRPEDEAARIPAALPLVDLLWRLPQTPLGGRLLLEANSLGLIRREGQSMARASASVRWDRSWLTPMGQRVTLTGLARGDLYHVSDSALADEPLYAGRDGFTARAIPLAAVDIEWPLAGSLLGGSQVLNPRVQLVASTTTANESIPNEDARAIDLEESNLFALNRFPGLDRWEGGARITYGLDWRWSRPRLEARAQIGQSYRLDNQAELFPDGTGLASRLSDIVGRMSLRIGSFVELTQRLRIDKDSLAIRRSELDVAVGTRRSFVSVGYLKFNRNIDLEDLTDHEEVRAGARLAFGRFWALFGSAVVDLTSTAEDPLTVNDGFQPIRHRLGLSYSDECFDLSLSWKRNYVDNPNARRGNTFLFSVSLKNLG